MAVPAETDLDLRCINTIRTLAMDAVQKANSGHPGAPMGMAPMAWALWSRHLKHNPANPDWADRDRFVLSAGHASMLLYSLLHLTGYDLPLDEIRQFRQWGSKTPGHPERAHAPGVEITTGPLGAGFAMGVGMAIAERYLAARFNRPGHAIVDHHVFGIVSDGDLMEGVASEAASLAGTLGLGKLVYLYDDNEISIDGSTDLAFREDVSKRFEAYGWHVESVDGDDWQAAEAVIERAVAVTDRPSLVVARTTIAYGSPNKAGSAAAHGTALGAEEVRLSKAALGWPADAEFLVPGDVREYAGQAVDRGKVAEAEWQERLARYEAAYPAEGAELRRMLSGHRPEGWDAVLPSFDLGTSMATRNASHAAINALAEVLPEMVGGSADLAESNKTLIKGSPPMSAAEPGGRNIYFGVREHAMGNILNGLALHGGLLPFAGTFLVFSDYMRPSIRLAAIQGAHVVYVFTHDSIGVGEDGPTHQPIEHLMSLRAMPGLTVLRPADANETAAAWRVAVETDGPVALALTRQNLTVVASIDQAWEGVARGGYVLAEPDAGPDALVIATGSEVGVAMAARDLLAAEGVRVRVVSMPSWELFAAQAADYRDTVLPPDVVARVSVEAGATLGWERWVGGSGRAVGIDHFGASAPAEVLFERFGFTAERVADEVRAAIAGAQNS